MNQKEDINYDEKSKVKYFLDQSISLLLSAVYSRLNGYNGLEITEATQTMDGYKLTIKNVFGKFYSIKITPL